MNDRQTTIFLDEDTFKQLESLSMKFKTPRAKIIRQLIKTALVIRGENIKWDFKESL